MREGSSVVEMACQRVDDLVCSNVVVKVNMLAMVDSLERGFGGGQRNAFLYRLMDQECVLR